MLPKITSLLAALSLAAASMAHAQAMFSIGPRVGLNIASASYNDAATGRGGDPSFTTSYRTGFEAGATACLGFGRFAFQPSLLYSQKGFGLVTSYAWTTGNPADDKSRALDTKYRLNYLSLPLNFAYAQQDDGQGFQLFAGPYLACLLGGRYTTNITQTYVYSGAVFTGSEEGQVRGSGSEQQPDYNTYLTDDNAYSRHLDFGVQGGLGYRRGAALLQVSYSQGVSNAGVRTGYVRATTEATTVTDPNYRNRAFQVSLAYLFGPR